MAEKKKSFYYMSSNEWLGDSTTHFMKTGNTLRSKRNDDLVLISNHIPKIANGVKVEYDISYESPRDRIHGYKFTDLMTKVVMITPCNYDIAVDNLRKCIRKGVTQEGLDILNKIRDNLNDKYILEDVEVPAREVVIMPGTNLITKEGGWVDLEKVDELVKNGAYVKLHPVTAKVWQTIFKNRWGDHCLGKDVALYPLVRRAEKTYFCMNSETGLSSAILGKKLGVVDKKDRKGKGTFEHVYRAIDTCGVKDTMYNRIAALFSHPESGFITVYHDNYEEKVNTYFEHMKNTYRHKE